MAFVPRIVDVSHWTDIDDLAETAEAGIWGIIAKATQGTYRIDPKYKRFKEETLANGMLFGAYHFNTGENPKKQVDFFLDVVKPDDKTLMALDYEKNEASRTATNMKPHQMVEFLRYGEEKLGRKMVIYSGNYLKEAIVKLPKEDRLYVCQHRLWLAHYSSKPKLPIGFERYWIHQYTGDGLGPEPHSVPGLGGEAGGLDLNVYDGTREQLIAEWAS